MKNNKGLIILVIIVVIAMSQGEKKESSSGFSTEDACLDRWDNLYQGCYTDCFFIHQDLINECSGLAVQNLGWWVFYKDNECDFLSSEQELVNCLEDNGIGVTYVQVPEGCTGPDADETEFACRFGDVDQCIGGVWDKIGDCSDWSGYTDSCDTFPLISRNDEDDAVKDCAEEVDVDVWCLEKDCTQYTCRKQSNTCSIATYFSTEYTTSTACQAAAPTVCGDIPPPDCTPILWLPLIADKACGTSFTQTTNCVEGGTDTRTATGTKDCPEPGIGCVTNSDCYVNGVNVGKECSSKGRCVSSCLPILQQWDSKEGQCKVSSIVIIAIIFMVAMVALKTIGKK